MPISGGRSCLALIFRRLGSAFPAHPKCFQWWWLRHDRCHEHQTREQAFPSSPSPPSSSNSNTKTYSIREYAIEFKTPPDARAAFTPLFLEPDGSVLVSCSSVLYQCRQLPRKGVHRKSHHVEVAPAVEHQAGFIGRDLYYRSELA